MCVVRPSFLVPVRRVRRCWSSPLQGEATPFSPSAGCGPLSWSITASHAMTVSAYVSVRSPLVGGGLYALRAGRCGCDSLSLAGSRQRVKSLRSSVRLRLVIHTARSILSRRVFHSASTTHPLRSCSVSAPFPTHLPRARSPARLFLTCTPFVPHYGTPVADSQCGIPIGIVYVRLRYSPFRSVPSLRRDCPYSARSSLQRTDSAALHGFPRSHLSLPADSSCVADCFQSHLS